LYPALVALVFIKFFVAETGKQILFMEKKIRVLIVDDSHSVRRILKTLLAEMENAEWIGEAADGNAAITLSSELSPDIILMDINMSSVNGFDATQTILLENPATKIIGLSLHAQSAYAKKLLGLGAQGYVIKTSPHTDIIEAINIVASGGIFVDKTLKDKI
jgi:DNA-binding NarL/FixJ family response regulator